MHVLSIQASQLGFYENPLILYYMYLFTHIQHMYSTYARNEHKDNGFHPTVHAILPDFILLGPVLVSQTSDLVIQLSLLVFTLFSNKKIHGQLTNEILFITTQFLSTVMILQTFYLSACISLDTLSTSSSAFFSANSRSTNCCWAWLHFSSIACLSSSTLLPQLCTASSNLLLSFCQKQTQNQILTKQHHIVHDLSGKRIENITLAPIMYCKFLIKQEELISA